MEASTGHSDLSLLTIECQNGILVVTINQLPHIVKDHHSNKQFVSKVIESFKTRPIFGFILDPLELRIFKLWLKALNN